MGPGCWCAGFTESLAATKGTPGKPKLMVEIDPALVPEGWEAARVAIPGPDEPYAEVDTAGRAIAITGGSPNMPAPVLILRQKQPRRWEVEEIFDKSIPMNGTLLMDRPGRIEQPFRIVREIPRVADDEFAEVDEARTADEKFATGEAWPKAADPAEVLPIPHQASCMCAECTRRKVVKFTFLRRGKPLIGEWVKNGDDMFVLCVDGNWLDGFDIYERTETDE